MRDLSLPIAIAILTTGVILKLHNPGISVFHFGMIFAWMWLAMATFFIRRAWSTAETFLEDLTELVKNRYVLQTIRDEALSLI